MSHWELIDKRCYRIVEATIDTLDRSDVRFELAGGWAVYAHVPTTPSIDTDILLNSPLPRRVEDALAADGFRVGPHKEIEPLDRNATINFWAHGDEDLGIPLPGFCIATLLEDHVVTRELTLPTGPRLVDVPDPAALALLKSAALSNRDLAYRSFFSGRAGMLLGPGRIPQIRQLSDSYYLRKAAKDLFDLSLLISIHDTGKKFRELAHEYGMAMVLPSLVADLADAVIAAANDMANRVRRPAPAEMVAASLNVV